MYDFFNDISAYPSEQPRSIGNNTYNMLTNYNLLLLTLKCMTLQITLFYSLTRNDIIELRAQ